MTDHVTIEEITKKINPITNCLYKEESGLLYLPSFLKNFAEGASKGLNLTPDYQRGHVWTSEQQLKFIQNLLKGVLNESLLTFSFNHPGQLKALYNKKIIHSQDKKNILPDEIQCLDGVQRLTALLKFIDGEIYPFGYSYAELKGYLRLQRIRLQFQVYSFQTKAEILQFYLDINSGGVVHSQEELKRVEELLSLEKKF